MLTSAYVPLALALGLAMAVAACGRIGYDDVGSMRDGATHDGAMRDGSVVVRDGAVGEPSCPVGGCTVMHGWSRRFGSSEVDFLLGAGRDAARGRFVVTGLYATEVVDYGDAILPWRGFHDVVVASFDDDGGHLWSFGFGGPGFDEGYALTLDAAGSPTIVGRAADGMRVGAGPLLAGHGGDDVLVARLTAGGEHVWSGLHGGPGSDIGRSVAVDDAGNAYVAGTFEQTATFGGAALGVVGSADAFLASYARDGSHRWSRAWGSVGADPVGTVAVDSARGTVLVSGAVSGDTDLGGTAAAIRSAGGTDGYVAAFDSATGVARWQISWGAAGEDGCNGITLDDDGNVYATGFFFDTITIGGTPLTSAGIDDIALFSATPDGEIRWADRYGGPGNDRAVTPRVGSRGEVVVGGVVSSTATFGRDTVTATDMTDALLFVVTRSGEPLWARAFGGVGQDEAQCVAIDDAGRVFLAGAFTTTIDFGGGTLVSAGGFDSFVARVDSNVLPAP